MKRADMPPGRPYGRLSKKKHEEWWMALLAILAASYAVADCRAEARSMELTENLNAIGKWRVGNRNAALNQKVRRAYWAYEEAVKDAAIFCPEGLHKHITSSPFHSLSQLIRQQTPHSFRKHDPSLP